MLTLLHLYNTAMNMEGFHLKSNKCSAVLHVKNYVAAVE